MIGTNIILVVCIHPFLFLMYFLIKNEAAPKKKMYFGVTLTKEQQKEPEVVQLGKEYEKQMRTGLLILAIAPIPMVFIPWFSIFMCGWMVWLMATIFAFFIPFGIANTKLKALKLEKGWKQQTEQVSYTEIKAAGSIRLVKWYEFLPPCVIGVAAFLWTCLFWKEEGTRPLMLVLSSMGVMTLLFWWAAVWMDKQKTQVISTDSNVNVNYARAKKRYWKIFWLVQAWCFVCYVLGMLVVMSSAGKLSGGFWFINFAYMAVTIIILVWLVIKKNALERSYQEKKDVIAADEDDNWIWGMVYYNPKDNHSMVEKRTGIGTTMNMATVVGKVTVGILALSLLSLPLLGIWLIMTEFTPIRLEVKDNYVIASHLKEEHRINEVSVREAELITKLPDMSRDYGTSMDALRKGSYKVDGEEENCSVFLNPQNSVFIRIETSERVYYLSGAEDKETIAVYEAIK